MRENKYKIWDSKYKCWEDRLGHIALMSDGRLIWISESRGGDVRVYGDECEVVFYTDLKDKKGIEIYEGDIIELLCHEKCIGVYAQVKYWNAGWWFFTNRDTKGMMYEICRTALNNNGQNACKVIGNIYENPELLESHE